MSRYAFMQVDAFTERPLAGNPCALIFEADDLSDGLMLSIAREMNLSETAFVTRSETCDFGVRFFTPAEEIPLAGHPTIATVHALIQSSRISLEGEKTELTLELIGGPIHVEICTSQANLPLIIMTQRKPAFLSTFDPAEIMPAFGLEVVDALPGYPVQTVSTGTPQLMVPVSGHEALRRVRLDIPAYARLRQSADFFSPHLFCLGGITDRGNTFARHFGVPPDTPEDPFTGSATGGMGAYLWRYGLIDKPTFIAEQGHWMGRPGHATVEVIGHPDEIEAVKVGGTAVTILSGELALT
jgi:trans-2,3-dihydro-3-hydroxyanthranilate isomerase